MRASVLCAGIVAIDSESVANSRTLGHCELSLLILPANPAKFALIFSCHARINLVSVLTYYALVRMRTDFLLEDS